MPQSQILNYGAKLTKQSYFLSWIWRQIDLKEKFRYESEITNLAKKPIQRTNIIFDWISQQSLISILSKKIDFKSITLLLFIVLLVVFPGYGTSDTGVTLLPNSPVNSVASQGGFALNLLIFMATYALLLVVFAKDLKRQFKTFGFSRFEILLLLFIISLAASTLFSTYLNLSFLWLVKVVRGISIYFIFSRLALKKSQIFWIGIAFLSVIYIESTLSIIQYFRGGFIGLPIETAQSTASNLSLFLKLNSDLVFRPTGTLGHSNTVPFLAAFALPVCLIFTIDKNKLLRISYLFSIFLSVIVAFVSFSRWGTFTLFFSLILMTFIMYKVKIKKLNGFYVLRVVMSLIFIAIAFLMIKSDVATRFLQFSQADSSLATRMQLVIQALYVYTHNLFFGIGGGSFSQYLISYDFTPLQVSNYFPAPVHSLYLLLLSETGIVAFLIFLTSISYLLLHGTKVVKKFFLTKDIYTTLFTCGLLISLLAYLFNSLWELRSLDQHLLFGIFCMNLGIYFNVVRRQA